MQAGLFKRLITALGSAFGDLANLFGSTEGFQELLDYLGWSGNTLPPSYKVLAARATDLRAAITALADEPDYADLAELAVTITQLIEAIEALQETPAGITDPDFLPVFTQQVIGLLVIEGCKRYLPAAYYLLSAIGVIVDDTRADSASQELHEGKKFNLVNFKALLTEPKDYLANYLGWGEDFEFTPELQHNITKFLKEVGGNALIQPADETNSSLFDTPARDALHLPFSNLVNGNKEQLFSVTLVPETVFATSIPFEEERDLVEDFTLVSPTIFPTDELILNLLSGAAPPAPVSLTDKLKITFADFSNALKFRLGKDGISFADNTSPIAALALNPAVALSYAPDKPLIFIGEPGKTRLQADAVELALALSANGADAGAKLELKAINSVLIIDGGEGNSFLGKVLAKSTIAVPLSVSLSSQDGLRFNGANAFQIKTTPNQKVGPVLFRRLTLGISSTKQANVQLQAHADIAISLGPVTAAASDLGVSFAIKDVMNPKDISLGFDLPKGIEIAVAADLVTGGGYLFFDPATHTYAGAATLTLKTTARELNLNALGLLQTQLPGRPDAYSLLLLITAQFSPIDLGLGFTLSGLGGLVGVNRAANQEYLLGMVRQGELKKLLFPASVLDDPAGALALIDAAFPATEGRYVIGLLARLGWGSAANIITLDVALLVELPAPVRIVLLGVLQAVLPSAQNDKLKLRADFLGVVDFGAKKASFDASLTDSHILNFALTGDLAFRLYQGSNPLFVITAGGFHPAFQPPAGAGLAGLRRLRLALAQGGDLQLKLDSYFAVTANTVQFGAHLDLTYQLARGFRVEGHFGFDVLFQFSPFRLLAHVEAGVAIMRGNSELLGIHLSLDVTGPGPWHIWGEASFKIWFIKIGVNVNATIGASAPEPTLPAPDVHALLVQALGEPASWQVEAPAAQQPASVLLRPVVAAGQVVLDPRGALSLRQRVAPLGLILDKYGSAPTLPRNGRQFELTELRVGQATYAAGTKGREEVRDFFVPDQFTQLTDAQKLSAPSFQQLPNGARIRSLDALVAAPRATRRIVEYERKDLLSGATGGSTRFGADTFRQLGRGSALGQAVLAALPSGRAAQPVGWQEDTFEVVFAATLDPYPAGQQAPAPFLSQAEAEQYRQQQPAPASLLVVASYELATA